MLLYLRQIGKAATISLCGTTLQEGGRATRITETRQRNTLLTGINYKIVPFDLPFVISIFFKCLSSQDIHQTMQSFIRSITGLTSTSRYRLATRLRGHIGAINSVAMSKDGAILASGGEQFHSVDFDDSL